MIFGALPRVIPVQDKEGKLSSGHWTGGYLRQVPFVLSQWGYDAIPRRCHIALSENIPECDQRMRMAIDTH